MMKGIANPQLKAGGLQIRRNEVNMVKKKSKNSCLKRSASQYFHCLKRLMVMGKSKWHSD